MPDEGMEGRYNPLVIDSGSLMDLQKIAGPPPMPGKHWVMVDLNTGQLKWYMPSRRRSYGGGYRRPYYPRRRRY